MKTDLYTKIILTIIAVALVGHLIKDIDFVSKVQASKLPQPEVSETNSSGVIDVNIAKVNGSWISNKIPVEVK